jgi:hypothetical protein
MGRNPLTFPLDDRRLLGSETVLPLHGNDVACPSTSMQNVFEAVSTDICLERVRIFCCERQLLGGLAPFSASKIVR